MFFSQSEKLQVPNLYISLNMDEGQKRERERLRKWEKEEEGGIYLLIHSPNSDNGYD